jgi:hypothetical protein
MCYFITLGINKLIIEEMKKQLPSEINIKNNNNHSIKEKIPPHCVAVNLITYMCSCDLFSRFDEKDKEKLILKYRKKNWSTAKIERTLNSKIQSHGLREDLKNFLSNIATNNKIYFLIHWYTGDPDTESLLLEDKIVVSKNDIMNNTVDLKEDVLYEISSDKGDIDQLKKESTSTTGYPFLSYGIGFDSHGSHPSLNILRGSRSTPFVPQSLLLY